MESESGTEDNFRGSIIEVPVNFSDDIDDSLDWSWRTDKSSKEVSECADVPKSREAKPHESAANSGMGMVKPMKAKTKSIPPATGGFPRMNRIESVASLADMTFCTAMPGGEGPEDEDSDDDNSSGVQRQPADILTEKPVQKDAIPQKEETRTIDEVPGRNRRKVDDPLRKSSLVANDSSLDASWFASRGLMSRKSFERYKKEMKDKVLHGAGHVPSQGRSRRASMGSLAKSTPAVMRNEEFNFMDKVEFPPQNKFGAKRDESIPKSRLNEAYPSNTFDLKPKIHKSRSLDDGVDQMVKSFISAFQNGGGNTNESKLATSSGLNPEEINVLTKMMRRLSNEKEPDSQSNDDLPTPKMSRPKQLASSTATLKMGSASHLKTDYISGFDVGSLKESNDEEGSMLSGIDHLKNSSAKPDNSQFVINEVDFDETTSAVGQDDHSSNLPMPTLDRSDTISTAGASMAGDKLQFSLNEVDFSGGSKPTLSGRPKYDPSQKRRSSMSDAAVAAVSRHFSRSEGSNSTSSTSFARSFNYVPKGRNSLMSDDSALAKNEGNFGDAAPARGEDGDESASGGILPMTTLDRSDTISTAFNSPKNEKPMFLLNNVDFSGKSNISSERHPKQGLPRLQRQSSNKRQSITSDAAVATGPNHLSKSEGSNSSLGAGLDLTHLDRGISSGSGAFTLQSEKSDAVSEFSDPSMIQQKFRAKSEDKYSLKPSIESDFGTSETFTGNGKDKLGFLVAPPNATNHENNSSPVPSIRRVSLSSTGLQDEGNLIKQNEYKFLSSTSNLSLSMEELPPKEDCGDILVEGMKYLSKSMLVNVYAKLREMSVLGHASVKFQDIDVNSHQFLSRKKEMKRLGLLSPEEENKGYLENTKTAGFIVRAVLEEYGMMEKPSDVHTLSEVERANMLYDASLLAEFKTWVEESKVKQLDSVTEGIIKKLREECSKRWLASGENLSSASLRGDVRQAVQRRRNSLVSRSESFNHAEWVEQEETLIADHFGLDSAAPPSRSDCLVRQESRKLSKGVLTSSFIKQTLEDSSDYFEEGSVMKNLLETGFEVTWFSDRHPDDIIYGIGVNRQVNSVTVLFRGREGVYNLLKNSSMMECPNPLIHEDYQGNSEYVKLRTFVAEEMLRVRRDIKKSTIEEIRDRVEIIGKELTNGGRYHLSITGHNVGGSMATILGFYLAADPTLELASAVRVFTFAAPRVGCSRFQCAHQQLEESGRLLHARFSLSNGIISRLPMCAFKDWEVDDRYRHVGMHIRLHPTSKAGRDRTRQALDVSYNQAESFFMDLMRLILNCLSSLTWSNFGNFVFSRKCCIKEYQLRMHFAREYRLALGSGVLRFDKKRKNLKSLHDYYLMKCRAVEEYGDVAKKRSPLPTHLSFLIITCLITFELAILIKFVSTW